MLPATIVTACLTQEALRLILMPTEACNFRCAYCYEDFALGRMDPDVVRGVRALIARRLPELRRLTLDWFGGEPLLAKDVIVDTMRWVGEQAAASDVTVRSAMTTNAYLLDPATFAELVGLGVETYQIAFDGPREYHDRRRRLAGGQGTFGTIWRNVEAMRKVPGDFSVIVRLHLDAETVAGAPEFVDAYNRTFGDDGRFGLFIRPVSPLGGAGDATFPFLDDGAARDAVADLQQQVRRPADVPDPAGDWLQLPVCYAAHANSYVVRADGRVNKCTVALEEPANQVGHLTPEGELVLYEGMARKWFRGLLSEDRGELECPMHGLADPPVPESLLQIGR